MPGVRDRQAFGDLYDSGESQQERVDVHRVFQEFADGTSMHGVPRIINARSIPARFFWSIICMGAFGMFLWQCGILLERYYSYPKKVMVEIVQRPVPFPAVSVCNTDFLDQEAAYHLQHMILEQNVSFPPDPELRDFLDQYQSFMSHALNLLPLYQHEFKDNKAKLHEDMAEVFSRLGLVANLGFNLSSSGSIKLSNFISNCRFMDDSCNASNSFRKIFDPYYFNCFTFQPESILDSPSTRLQGVEYGLTLLLFTSSAGQVSLDGFEMLEDELSFLPGLQESDSALASGQGVRLVVHSPGTRPHPTADGYDIPPGFSVTIGVKARENVRIRHPHGNCSAVGRQTDPLTMVQVNDVEEPKYSYTLMDCQNECIQRTIMDTCHCVDNRINMVDNKDNLPFCFKVPSLSADCEFKLMQVLIGEGDWSLLPKDCGQTIKTFSQRMECRKEVYENMTISDPDSMNKCECYPPCNDIIYDASYSLSTLPERTPAHSSFYSNIVKFIYNLPEKQHWLLNRSLGEDYEDKLKKNIIRLNVHISDSNIIKTSESPDYEAIRLVSDIGGQLGLWIGISVMTIFEVLQLVADIFRFLTSKGRHVGERHDRMMDSDMRNSHYGNGDQRYIRPSHLDPEACEIDKLTTV